MTSTSIIKLETEWNEVYSIFADFKLIDIYFDFRYVSLYANNDVQLEAFIYRDDVEIFWFPYLRRKIGLSKFNDHCDFESAYGYGGPLSSTTDPEFLGRAWKAFETQAKDSKLIAGFIRFHPLLETERFAENGPVKVKENRPTVRLTLNQTPEEIWNTYPRDNKEKIKKSIKAGVSVSSHTNLEAMKEFSKLYIQRMRELQAEEEYFFDETYFQNIAKLSPSKYRIYLALHENKIVGGCLILLSNRFVHYHLSATPKEFQKLSVNNRLRHEVIQNFLENDYEQIHFGGGRTTAADDPLLAFKKKFSSEEGRYFVGSCILDSEVYRQVVDHWEKANPEKIPHFGNRLLCYHY